jgi:autotransporter-associated beta strand protein
LVNIFGGRALIITDDANKVFNGNISGGGSLILAAGASQTLAGDNTLSGSTFINSGAVLTIAEGGSMINGSSFIQLGNTIVNGLLKQQDIDIRSGVLSGNGTVEANRMTVQANAQIKPGDSTGTLVLITDLDLLGGLETEIKNIDFFDVLAVDGSVSLHDTTYFNFVFDESFMPQEGDAFQFITSTEGFDFGIDLNFDAWFNTDNFSVLGLLEGLNWRISYFDGSQLTETSYLSLVLFENVTNPVSAPAGLMLIGFGMILLCSYARRQKVRT